jgi:hypothetical protein
MYEVEDLRHLRGGDRITFTWIQDVFAPNLGIGAVKVDQVITRSSRMYVTVEFTAPTTVGTDIYFNAWVNQLGGDSATLVRKHIKVANSAPPPPAAPRLVTVPDVRGMTLEQGRKTLASVNLGIAPQGRDNSVPESEQTIYAQMPGKGSQVLERVKINVSLGMQSYVSPAGFSALPIINCYRTTFHLWEYVNDQGQQHEDIPPMWGDGGICPGSGQEPILHTLTDGTWQFYVVVDPARCKEGNDPRYPACWAADLWIKGDAKGPVSPFLNN